MNIFRIVYTRTRSLQIANQGIRPIGRRRNNSGDSYRVDEQIRASEIRVIDPEGEQIGVMETDEALDLAKQKYDLDLVEVAPNADVPVCRIMDYGKFKYQQSKKKQAKSDNVSLKTLRIRPKTQEHDLNTKLNRAQQFLKKGNQVQFVLQMKGRERKFEDRWMDKVRDLLEDLEEKVEREIQIVNPPEAEGWTIKALVEPR